MVVIVDNLTLTSPCDRALILAQGGLVAGNAVWPHYFKGWLSGVESTRIAPICIKNEEHGFALLPQMRFALTHFHRWSVGGRESTRMAANGREWPRMAVNGREWP
jgi:hypothetical protein